MWGERGKEGERKGEKDRGRQRGEKKKYLMCTASKKVFKQFTNIGELCRKTKAI